MIETKLSMIDWALSRFSADAINLMYDRIEDVFEVVSVAGREREALKELEDPDFLSANNIDSLCAAFAVVILQDIIKVNEERSQYVFIYCKKRLNWILMTYDDVKKEFACSKEALEKPDGLGNDFVVFTCLEDAEKYTNEHFSGEMLWRLSKTLEDFDWEFLPIWKHRAYWS